MQTERISFSGTLSKKRLANQTNTKLKKYKTSQKQDEQKLADVMRQLESGYAQVKKSAPNNLILSYNHGDPNASEVATLSPSGFFSTRAYDKKGTGVIFENYDINISRDLKPQAQELFEHIFNTAQAIADKTIGATKTAVPTFTGFVSSVVEKTRGGGEKILSTKTDTSSDLAELKSFQKRVEDGDIKITPNKNRLVLSATNTNSGRTIKAIGSLSKYGYTMTDEIKNSEGKLIKSQTYQINKANCDPVVWEAFLDVYDAQLVKMFGIKPRQKPQEEKMFTPKTTQDEEKNCGTRIIKSSDAKAGQKASSTEHLTQKEALIYLEDFVLQLKQGNIRYESYEKGVLSGSFTNHLKPDRQLVANFELERTSYKIDAQYINTRTNQAERTASCTVTPEHFDAELLKKIDSVYDMAVSDYLSD